jgi:hypothetical protein
MRNSLLIISLVILTYPLFGQNATDALRYSYLQPMSTARSIGVGGSLAPLGGDFSSLSINPAGIGGFWRSEISFTPSFSFLSAKSTLNPFVLSSTFVDNPTSDETNNHFSINNLGLVITNRKNRGDWRTTSFGIGLNKFADYKEDFFYQGDSPGTIVERFAALGFGLHPDDLDDFESGLAYETGAIYDVDDDFIYETDFDFEPDELIYRQQLVDQTGYYNELSLSFGGNYKDQLLLGATVGIPFIYYSYDKQYIEDDPENRITAFEQLSFDEFLRTEGSGINFKIGVIAKIYKMFRLGVAVHSPSFIKLNDRYSNELSYAYEAGNGVEQYTSGSPEGEFEYKITTPWRAVGSVAAIFNENGFITADVEYVDYSDTKFNFTYQSDDVADREYQEEVNDEIDAIYNSAINIRVGGEFVVDVFRFRAGYQRLGSPFTTGGDDRSVFSGGLGLRGNKAYLDLGFAFSTMSEGYQPYLIRDTYQQRVNKDIDRAQVSVTVGFKL